MKGSASARAATIIAMYRGERSGLGRRSYDNCWEAGDGDKVQAVMRRRIAADPALARQIVHGRVYGCGYRERGEPDYGASVWRYVNYSLLAAALDCIGEAPPSAWGPDTAARIDEARAKHEAAAVPQLELAI